MDGVRGGIVKLRLAGRGGWVRVGMGAFLPGTGFLTGIALGTGKTLLSDFFRVKVSPFFIFTISVSSLKLSTSTFPSSYRSPFCNPDSLVFNLIKNRKVPFPIKFEESPQLQIRIEGFGWWGRRSWLNNGRRTGVLRTGSQKRVGLTKYGQPNGANSQSK